MSYNRYDLAAFESNNESNNVKLEYISSSRYEGDWKSTPHSHTCTELFYVVSGVGTFQVENGVFPVSSEDIIIINPGVEHAESALKEAPLEYIVLGLESGLSFATDNVGYCTFNAKSIDEHFSFYLREILNEMDTDVAYSKLIAQNFLNLLVAKLLRHQKIVLTEPKNNSKYSESAQVKRYIDHHFSEDITLETLAKVAHLNKYYLVHTFTKENKISPINYLIQRRLKESKYLLSNTNYSIAEIAQHTGFSSSSYFSQSFNKAEGMTPRQYRQQNTK